ncbi:hypothetical protein D3C75_550970 [compost metagenome]
MISFARNLNLFPPGNRLICPEPEGLDAQEPAAEFQDAIDKPKVIITGNAHPPLAILRVKIKRIGFLTLYSLIQSCGIANLKVRPFLGPCDE